MVISKKDLNKPVKKTVSFVEIMSRLPWVGAKLRLSRNPSLTRKIKL